MMSQPQFKVRVDREDGISGTHRLGTWMGGKVVGLDLPGVEGAEVSVIVAA